MNEKNNNMLQEWGDFLTDLKEQTFKDDSLSPYQIILKLEGLCEL